MESILAMKFAKACWTLLWMLWLALWFWRKKTKQNESPGQILQHLLPLVLGFWLVFGPDQVILNLSRRILPATPPILWLALALTILGIAICIIARLTLGTNWSGVVALKTNHELIRAGLYRFIRHPIYTGLLTAVLGTALIPARLQGFLGFAVIYFTFLFKARREEQFLQTEFGPSYNDYVQQTGMFLPKMF